MGTIHTFSLRNEKIFIVRSLLIISPQALRNGISSHQVRIICQFLSLLIFFLRSFAHLSWPHAFRVKEMLVTGSCCGVPTRAIRYSRQSTIRKYAIEIPSYEFSKWGFAIGDGHRSEEKKDQFKPSRMLFQRRPLLLREYVVYYIFAYKRIHT